MDIQGQVNITHTDVWNNIKKKYKVRERISMLPWAGVIGKETRRLYFNLAVKDGKMVDGDLLRTVISGKIYDHLPVNRLISYGECNVSCPYCKRDMQFVTESGEVINTVSISIDEVLRLCLWALTQNETPRFSGGDPVSFKNETLAIAEYLYLIHDAKMSIAHNGTWGQSIKSLVPYLSSAAIDLKATPDKLGNIMGVKISAGDSLYRQSLKTQATLTSNKVLVDIRTPIFGNTSLADMETLAKDIHNANDLSYVFWTWRLYKKVEGCDWEVPDLETVKAQMLHVSKLYPMIWMGMRAKWQAGGMLYVKNGKFIDLSSGGDKEKNGSGNGDLS